MRRLFLFLSILILLVAAALRLSDLHRYPPGPHYDEAVYLLITRSIAFGGARPFPIVEAYQGREVLYMYLNAPLLHLWGDNIFTLRVSSAFLNLLTIAASMGLGRAMFRGRRGLAVGLVVGLLMALSFPQIWLARQAFRAVTLPFCQAVALYALWRGLTARRRSWGWLAAGGLFAGLALYTYMASRLFPLWLALGGLALLAADSKRRGLRLRQELAFFGVLLVVIAPMVVYAVQKPDIFLGRLAEVTQPEQSVSLAESILLHARMFFIEGDPYLRYNIPGRPYFTPLEGLFLLAGLLVAAARLARPGRAAERAACALALLSPLMALPSVISVGGLPPSHMRSLGMVPLIFVPVALGVTALVEAAASRLRPVPAARLAVGGGLVVLLAGGLRVGGEYLGWASRADVFYETDADLAAAARWVNAHADEDTLVYVAARDRGHPTFMAERAVEPTWLGTDSLFRPPPGQTALVIFPRSASPPEDWTEWLEPGRISDLPLGPDGRTAFEAFTLSGAVPLPEFAPPPTPAANRFLSLIGAPVRAVEAGALADTVSAWAVRDTPDAADLTPIVQLETVQGVALARSDVYMTETDRWRAGEVLMQRAALRVPLGTPPGQYPLRVAWVARASDRYLPYGQGSVWETVGYLDVQRPATFPDPAALPIDMRVAVDVAPGVRLLGWSALPAQARPGEALPLALFWQATPHDGARAPLAPDLALTRMGEERLLLIGDSDSGHYGADQWIDGEVVMESERVRLPRLLPAGDYDLELRSGSTIARLGHLRIEGEPRLFDAPSVAYLSGVLLGGQIELYGYDLVRTGAELNLTLVWRSVRAVNDDYTVFVHLLDADGRIVAQHDTSPAAGSYPTSLWTPGEYIVDQHHFTGLNPSTRYAIVAGLYSQASGERLKIDSHNNGRDDTILLNNIAEES